MPTLRASPASRILCGRLGWTLHPPGPDVDNLSRNCTRAHGEWIVASLDRKRLGQILGASGMTIRGVFDEETRRKPLAFAADAVRYGI